MLALRVSGDSHPKTFTLVTDDADAELERLRVILHEEIEADEEDPIRKWFDTHTAEQFEQGVEVPTDWVGELEDVLGEDWPDAANVISKQRDEAVAQAEEAMSGE